MDKVTLQRFPNPWISRVLTGSSLWCLQLSVGAHSRFPCCHSSVQHMSRCGLNSALPWHSRVSLSQLPAASFPGTLRSKQGMGRTRDELWDTQPVPSHHPSQGKCARGRMKGKEGAGPGPLGSGGAAWGEQDNVEFTSSSTKWPGSSCAPAEFMGHSDVQVFFGF